MYEVSSHWTHHVRTGHHVLVCVPSVVVQRFLGRQQERDWVQVHQDYHVPLAAYAQLV